MLDVQGMGTEYGSRDDLPVLRPASRVGCGVPETLRDRSSVSYA